MMAVSKIVSVKCVIKGHHVYRITYSCGTYLDCFFEPDNQHSDSAIIVKKGDNTVGHIPEGLCQSLTQLHKEGSIVHHFRNYSAAEGTFVQGRGLEIPCIYDLIWTTREKDFCVRRSSNKFGNFQHKVRSFFFQWAFNRGCNFSRIVQKNRHF